MARSIGFSEPSELVAGDTWQWNRQLPDFPPSEAWEVSYSFAGEATDSPDIRAQASSSGEYFEVRATPEITEKFKPGPRAMVGYASKGTKGQPDYERHRFYVGTVRIAPNLDLAASEIPFARRALDAIEARLENRLTTDLEQFQINGRSVVHIPMEQLLKLRGVYRAELNRKARRGRVTRLGRVRFGRA